MEGRKKERRKEKAEDKAQRKQGTIVGKKKQRRKAKADVVQRKQRTMHGGKKKAKQCNVSTVCSYFGTIRPIYLSIYRSIPSSSPQSQTSALPPAWVNHLGSGDTSLHHRTCISVCICICDETASVFATSAT
jgi:hypothetical protein